MKFNYNHGGFARMKPFILAKGRYMISKVIEKNLDKNIVHCHTDGLVMERKISMEGTKAKLGAELGDLKYCGYDENCIIHNTCHYECDPHM
jgi:hypothetical protein